MIKDQVTVVPNELTHKAVNTSQLSFSTRKSLVLRLQLRGASFDGEASPLDGFGHDNDHLAHEELLQLDLAVFTRLFDASERFAKPLEPIFAHSASFRSPSARFAFETCALRYVSHQLKKPIFRLLCEHAELVLQPRTELGASCVLDPISSEAERGLRDARNAGIRTVKLKTGRDWDAEMSFVRRHFGRERSRLQDGVRLRLDPNRAWSPYELERIPAEELPLDWIEDPTSDPGEWAPYSSQLPLAIDEILIGEEPSRDFLVASGARVVILKPMALGGFAVALDWARFAHEGGLDVSVSHLFDGPVAFDAAVELAFAIQSTKFAPGLGPHAGLEGWNERPRTLAGVYLQRPDVTP